MVLMRFGLLLLVSISLVAQPYRDRLGVEVDGWGDGSRARPFVDHGKLHRPCTVPGTSQRVQTDDQGWPKEDAECVFFDIRPIAEWANQIDDPRRFQPDWSGAWSLAFEGKAEVTVPSGGATIEDFRFEESSNRTTARIQVAERTGLLILRFSRTEGGFKNLRLIRAGYRAETSQLFTNEFLRSFNPFRILRYMDVTETNGNTPSANPEDLLEWGDRMVPSHATQQSVGRKVGAAWEYAILLANQTGTDVWINVPVAASEDYIRELARLTHMRLNPSLRIFIEHGNEVWNSLFRNSYEFNRAAALADARSADDPIDDDGESRPEILSVRRHLRRTARAVRIFSEEFGREEVNRRLFGVFSWWVIQPSQYRNALAWYRRAYGEPDQWIYGLAHTHYFNIQGAGAAASPEELLAIMRRSIDGFRRWDDPLDDIAREFGIKRLVYEGGPDVGGGSTVNVGNRIEANRLPGMGDLILYNIRDNFFQRTGDIYAYFSHCGPCSRYGCWGATEDIINLGTPKMQALAALAGQQPEPRADSLLHLTRYDNRVSPGALVLLRGENLAADDFHWSEGSLSGSDLPAMLGGVQVRFNGITAPVLSVSPENVIFAVPHTLQSGRAVLEVFTRNGSISQSLELEPAAPGVVASPLDGRFYADASAGGEKITPVRPAVPGEEVSFTLSGLPIAAGSLPDFTAPPSPLPLETPAALAVRVGGAPAEVIRLETLFPGLSRVTIRVPGSLSAGSQRLIAEFEGIRSPTVWLPVGGREE